MNKEKGFTLIELLVVIAIIGILSSIVLASLNSARTKGQDASASASISSIRAQAELSFDNASPNSYDDVCTDTAVLQSAVVDANGHEPSCADNTNAWRVSAGLESASVSGFCADSTGFAGRVTADQSTTACTSKE